MKLMFLTSILLLSLIASSCTPSRDFDARLRAITKSHRFSIARWESKTIPQEINRWISAKKEETDDERTLVTEYFATTEQIKALKSAIEANKAGKQEKDLLEAELTRLDERKKALASIVERAIERQIRESLTQQGIYSPVTGFKVTFPPVNFKLEKPPRLLVISPRERIETIRQIILKPTLTPEESEAIEAKIDELGVSSLVVELGGLGATYPTLVTDETSLQTALDTTAEEWLHQYLLFKPLGFLYFLHLTGFSRDYEIAVMNETLASLVSQEIGSMVYEKYYSEYEKDTKQNQEAESDFNREMRAIRKTVDLYLARGEIREAEEFMEEKRQYLASKGYYLRKLNQAYFAFYGSYADKPAFLSPIGIELKELRAQTDSLKEFLNRVAAMTSREELKKELDRKPGKKNNSGASCTEAQGLLN